MTGVRRLGAAITCFLRPGGCERFKADVHGAIALLALGAFAYNGLAFLGRRRRHLAGNALIYAALVSFELEHVHHHQEAADAIRIAVDGRGERPLTVSGVGLRPAGTPRRGNPAVSRKVSAQPARSMSS